MRETGVEQFFRDARITLIYEGANGVQAMDLLGRKVLGSGGALARQLGGLIGGFCERHAGEGENAEFIVKLAGLLKEWSVATEEVAVRAARNPDETGAASMDYLQLTGYLCLAWCWAWMAAVSAAALKSGTPDAAFHTLEDCDRALLLPAHPAAGRGAPRRDGRGRGLAHDDSVRTSSRSRSASAGGCQPCSRQFLLVARLEDPQLLVEAVSDCTGPRPRLHCSSSPAWRAAPSAGSRRIRRSSRRWSFPGRGRTL